MSLYLSLIGRHFRLGVLLNKESVSARMESQEGMSFMEFSYQLFQANDYLKLFNTKVNTTFLALTKPQCRTAYFN